MLFADDIVVVDELRDSVNTKLKETVKYLIQWI